MGTCTSGVQPERKVSMWGVVLHMVALYVMGTCMSGVQPAKEGECVGCGFTHGGTVCDGDLYIWGTTSKGR